MLRAHMPRVLGSLIAVGMLLAMGACSSERKQPPIVLISIDTLRSDHLPAYGYRAIATPNIDRLARDGVVFEHAYANVPLTLPSHATMMTGRLPNEHGVRDNAGSTLDPATPTIASLLREAGYATGGAVSAYVLRRETNIHTGFETWDDSIEFAEGAPTGALQRGGEHAVAFIASWLRARKEQPSFAFVHLFEPHTPYAPTYDADIVSADRLVGELLRALDESRLYDDAVIVLVSDHGEGLGDHGEDEHGILLYREALQVPLIVKLPASKRRGERVTTAAQLADLLPTVAELTGVRVPEGLQGSSLLSLPAKRPLYAETLYPRIHLGWSELRSIVDFPNHLIHGPRPELYDLRTDPRELRDLRNERRRDSSRLTQQLSAFPNPAPITAAISAEERKKLAALGYVDAGVASVQTFALNPRDHLGDLSELKAVTELVARREHAAAAQRIEGLLHRNPQWSDLRDMLGSAYEELGDLERAEATYREAIRRAPGLAGEFALSLAGVLARQGNFTDAVAHAEIARKSNPAGAHDLLARIALARGDVVEAMREVEAMRAFRSHASQADLLLAEIYAQQGRREDALTLLTAIRTRATAARAQLPRRYWFLTGDVLAGLGRTADARVALERAIATEPGDADAYIALAFVEASAGDKPKAERVLQRLVAANPSARDEADQVRKTLRTR
jgi:arylsulfatase A-like enzyme/cytochrome c-type biogenesis protein CcmH/NrfG